MDKSRHSRPNIDHEAKSYASTGYRETRVDSLCELKRVPQPSIGSQLANVCDFNHGIVAVDTAEDDTATKSTQANAEADDASVFDVGDMLERLSLDTYAIGKWNETTGQAERLNHSRRYPTGAVLGCQVSANVSPGLKQISPSLWQAVLSSTQTHDSSTPALPVFRPGTWKEHKYIYNSTVAVLDRGQNKPLLASVSGWSHVNLMEHQLDQTYWTYKAFEFCDKIHHKLKSHFGDQQINGRFYASHAEKQLLAFSYFNHLKGKTTSSQEKRLKLYVTQKPCDDCALCFQSFANKTRFSIVLKSGQDESKTYKPERFIITTRKVPFLDSE